MARPLTILICCNAYPPAFIGGAELIAHYQALALQRMGHRVIIFAGEPSGSNRYEFIEDELDGLPVFRIRLVGEDYDREFVHFQHHEVEARFLELCARYSPDVVHMHNLSGLSAGIIRLAKKSGAKTVLTLHDFWGFCYKNTIIKTGSEICQDYSRCEECLPTLHDGGSRNIPIRMRSDFLAWQFGHIDRFVSPSTFLAQEYLRAGFPLAKMRVLWNGVEVDRFARMNKMPTGGRVRYGFLGFIGVHKGMEVLMDALRLLGDPRYFDINLVGVGDMTDRLMRHVKELRLEGHVHFWGKVPNAEIDQPFAHMDVLMLPSIWPENQPVSITEAMAAGKPVIGARIGGIPELVEDGVTGFLFEPGNARDLADKMWRFIENRHLIDEFGRRGQQRISNYSFERQARKLDSLYREI